MEEQREEGVLRVEDAMRPATDLILETDVVLLRQHPTGWSYIRRQKLEAGIREAKGELPLGSILDHRAVPALRPDLPLDTALCYADRWPLLPVVSRADFRQLEGIISQSDVLKSQSDVLKRYRDFAEA